MSVSLVFLKSAELDLKELKHYIAKNFGNSAWRSTYLKIQEAVSTIQVFPFGGAVPEELEKLNLTQFRRIISGTNRIIYEVRQDAVYIHIVCDTRKNMQALLTKRLLRIN